MKAISIIAALIMLMSCSSNHAGPRPSIDARSADAEQRGTLCEVACEPDVSIRAALATALPSVVRVYFGDGEMLTGTVISEGGLVLTCAHLPVAVGGAVEIGFTNGKRCAATVLSKLVAKGESTAGRDLAILKLVAPGECWPAKLAERTPHDPSAIFLAVGFPDTQLYGADRSQDPLYIRIGHPLRSPYPLLPGELLTSIRGTGGDSGGPLFDTAGRLVGVVHGGDLSGAHMTYTRIEVLHEHWGQLAPGMPGPAVSRDEPIDVSLVRQAQRVAGSCHESVVEICSNSRWVALGCVIAPGFVLTKSSELGTGLTVRTHDNYVAIAEIAATDPTRDLALLRIPYAPEVVSPAKPVTWIAADPPSLGGLVTLATPPFLAPIAGVVCVEPRAVPRIDGFIPCEFEPADGGIRVVRVHEEFRRYRLRPPPLALRPGDIVTAIEGTAVRSLDEYRNLMFDVDRIGDHPTASGEPITVSYTRDGVPANCTVVLEFSKTPSGQLVRPVSARYSSFPLALATDLPARPEHCGAPILDAQGRPVGILIACAPFVESLVIPAAEVARALEIMKFDESQR